MHAGFRLLSTPEVVFRSSAAPIDVQRHPATGQLWIATKNEDVRVIDPEQNTEQTLTDRAPYHYMGGLSALAFDEHGLALTTCQDTRNDYWGKLDANFFMGPTLYEMFPCKDGSYGRPQWSTDGASMVAPPSEPVTDCEVVSTIQLDGSRCAGGDCSLVHSDMLHEAPMCTGVAHEKGAVTEGGFRSEALHSGRVFWYLDGLHNELMRYDLSTGHGPGVLDHRTANIRRYIDVPLQHVEGVPSHMVVDAASSSLFIAQPATGSVLRVKADSGQFRRSAQCVPDECYPSHDGYVEGTCFEGYCDKNGCLDEDDGHGCYHIFTETADIFEYEIWTCTQQETFAEDLGTPAGIAVDGGFVFVSDFATGRVAVLDASGALVQWIPVSEAGVAGLDVSCDAGKCEVHVTNVNTNEVLRVVVELGAPGQFTWPAAPACPYEADYSRPQFNVTHGPGYQSTMVVPYSYGKHCDGAEPGQGFSAENASSCPDRADCEDVNGDAILMAGYLCHPCIPDVCSYMHPDAYCENLPGGLKCHGLPTEAAAVAGQYEADRSVVGYVVVQASGASTEEIEQVVITAAARAYSVDESRVSIVPWQGDRRLQEGQVRVGFAVQGATSVVPGGVTAEFAAAAEELGVTAAVIGESVELQCGDRACGAEEEEEAEAEADVTSVFGSVGFAVGVGLGAGVFMFLLAAGLFRYSQMRARNSRKEVKVRSPAAAVEQYAAEEQP
jgi:hypothetical protein